MCDYMLWEERCRLVKYVYPIVKGCEGMPFEMSRVYPLKQRGVKTIYETLKDNPFIKGVTIFGSSISQKCTYESDIDVALSVTENCTDRDKIRIVNTIQEKLDWQCDILWADKISDLNDIYYEIKEGLQII